MVSKQQTKTPRLANAPQQVKILAGQWRGTKLPVLLDDDVRPTPARVRETVFNWLQGIIVGSDCLDVFAGSGALGLEAASRGANTAQLVDIDSRVVKQLTQQIDKLQAQTVKICCRDALEFLRETQQVFDVIFLDPPFNKLHPFEILPVIQQQQLLKENGLAYVEFSTINQHKTLPEMWQWQRHSIAGEVEYGLISIKT